MVGRDSFVCSGQFWAGGHTWSIYETTPIEMVVICFVLLVLLVWEILSFIDLEKYLAENIELGGICS
jgi:hypothetical protein